MAASAFLCEIHRLSVQFRALTRIHSLEALCVPNRPLPTRGQEQLQHSGSGGDCGREAVGIERHDYHGDQGRQGSPEEWRGRDSGRAEGYLKTWRSVLFQTRTGTDGF